MVPKDDEQARKLSHESASVSPRCPPPASARWEWLSAEGLATAARRAVPIPRASVPHLVGRGGRGIRHIEDSLGLIVGIMDGAGGDATVTLIGPDSRMDLGAAVVGALVSGARSVLRRIAALV